MEAAIDGKAKKMRALGWLLVGLGGFLVVFAIGAGVLVVIAMDPGSGAIVGRLLVILAVMGATGCVSIVGGRSALRSGSLPVWVMVVMGVLGVAFLVMCLGIASR